LVYRTSAHYRLAAGALMGYKQGNKAVNTRFVEAVESDIALEVQADLECPAFEALYVIRQNWAKDDAYP
jgi:hypothetical protein